MNGSVKTKKRITNVLDRSALDDPADKYPGDNGKAKTPVVPSFANLALKGSQKPSGPDHRHGADQISPRPKVVGSK